MICCDNNSDDDTDDEATMCCCNDKFDVDNDASTTCCDDEFGSGCNDVNTDDDVPTVCCNNEFSCSGDDVDDDDNDCDDFTSICNDKFGCDDKSNSDNDAQTSCCDDKFCNDDNDEAAIISFEDDSSGDGDDDRNDDNGDDATTIFCDNDGVIVVVVVVIVVEFSTLSWNAKVSRTTKAPSSNSAISGRRENINVQAEFGDFPRQDRADRSAKMPNRYPRYIDLLYDEELLVPQVLADDDVASLDLGCGRTKATMRNNSELQPFAADWGADECSHDDEAVVVVCCRLHTRRSTAVCLPASSRRAQSSDTPTTSA
jgi:hypothetical protein